MATAILALNAGSSSIKFALFHQQDASGAQRIAHGELEGITTHPHFCATAADGTVLVDRTWPRPDTGADPHQGPVGSLIDWVASHLGDVPLVGVGHRVVHGGPDFIAPVRITPDVLARLDALTPFAPLHQPASLGPIRALTALHPDLPQVACFDTAFHHTMPATATRLALPDAYGRKGVRRYGFHGLSYEYIASCLPGLSPRLAAGRTLVAHLGNGASLCAMQAGRSIETTMGFSVLDGLVMGTRCGQLDPGVILYMLRAEKLDVAGIEDVLYRQSGLLGLSGVSSDMRDLQERAAGNDGARQALEMFTYRLVQQAGSMVAVLGGLDGLVFTAGIGEHDAPIRAAACARLSWLGLRLDAAANAAHAPVISTPDSAVEVRVIPTDEESMIRRHVADCLAGE
ncbi:acetate kinase [Gluconacetobacter diazotrophicus PA1 5]|uniref:acetate/propionate family kinase n=1 Tax=Gluconacetobacter diazotrophicus TaxID=33996 RepID=UPI000173C085|nr:acetate/propionate family kinase [Gluconacetobacter diazotrophicus]ACI51583.1 acetate kinase [Gluconacetobacter diazotrophicus PA1 5]TWB03428.1 acetate kinase [Gluconacetobacter diazotrophicus]